MTDSPILPAYRDRLWIRLRAMGPVCSAQKAAPAPQMYDGRRVHERSDAVRKRANILTFRSIIKLPRAGPSVAPCGISSLNCT